MRDEHTINTCFYVGTVAHRRLKPVSHKFRYSVFSLFIDIDELAILPNRTKWFRHNKIGLLSFMDKDHGPKDGTPLRPWIKEKLQNGGHNFDLGRVSLLCFPRIFGLVFNPLSIWYCYDTEENLRVILYEVRNTFGEWRGYMLPVTKESENQSIRQTCDKDFYVSPLMSMKCTYHFHLRPPAEQLTISIRETEEGARTLLAVQTGERKLFTHKNLLKIFWSHPLMYFKIITAIHWEALRTLLKGVKFHLNPKSKTGDVTYPGK